MPSHPRDPKPWGTKYHCDICGKTFRTYGAMLTHKGQAHGKKPGDDK